MVDYQRKGYAEHRFMHYTTYDILELVDRTNGYVECKFCYYPLYVPAGMKSIAPTIWFHRKMF